MRAGDRRTLGGLVLLVLCTGLAAWLLGTSDDKDAGGAGAGAAKSEPGATSAAVPAVGEKAAAPQALASDSPVVAATEADALPGEALRFTGRVVDEAGKPVANALVTHWPCFAFRQQVGLPRNPIWGGLTWEQLSATHTDAAGRFALDSRDVPPERVDSLAVDGGGFSSFEQVEQLWPHLLVEHEGFGTEEVQVPATHAGVGEAGDIVLHAGLTLTGRLVDPHGVGVAGVALALLSPERAEEGAQTLSDLQQLRITARTDAAGGFRLDGVPFGPWELSGEPAGFAPFDRDVRPQQPGLLDLGEIALDPGQALAGQVLDEHGAPLAGAEVKVQMMMPMDGARGPDRAAAAWGLRMRAGDRFFEPHVRTESDGSFVVQGLWTPIDSHRVSARAPGFDPAAADDVKPGTQDVVLQLEPEATWRVLVADAVDQRPVPGVKLEASRSIKDSEDWSGDVAVVADGDDGWLLHGAGRWHTHVTVAAPGHATTRFELDGLGAGESRQQQLLLPRELSIDGRVLDETGAPLPGASVKLGPDWKNSFLEDRTVMSGVDGRFHAGQLAPATWHITASAPGRVPLRRPREVVLTADAPPPPVELVLSAAGRIEGELRDFAGHGMPRVHVLATSKDPGVFAQVLPPGEGEAAQTQQVQGAIEAESFTGSDGRFTLECLPAGSWSLDGGSGAQATVQVTAGATTQAVLVRRPPARVEGRVSSGGAPLSGARVELGRADGFRYGWYPQMATKTDESGHYEFQRDAGGDFAVLARDGEVQTEPAFVHLAVDSIVHADLAFSTSRLSGRVTLAGDGTPLPGVGIDLKRPVGDAKDQSHLERHAVSGADGRFVVERMPAGSWSVAAFAGQLLAPQLPEVKVAEGVATPELSIEMSRAGDIDLILVSPETWGRVVLVELQPLAGQKPLQETFIPGRRAGLGPLQPGDYVLNLKTIGDDGKGWALRHTERVTIAAGQTLTLNVAD